MNKKLIMSLASLVTVAAIVVTPAIAQAEPHWYFEGNILVKKKTVKTSGELSFAIPGTTIQIRCNVTDAERLENPTGGGAGVDLMKTFKLSSCGPNPCPVAKSGVQGALTVKALKLPWATKLVEVPPIADEISGIELVFSCKKTGVLYTASGTLSPWVNSGFLEFNSPLTGTLGGMTVNGIDNFNPPGVAAKNP
jgi:hypothetical protein